MPLIVFEGTDGVGKSYWLRWLAEELKEKGGGWSQVISTREPWLMRDSIYGCKDERLKLNLLQWDRAIHVKKMKQWLKHGFIILCDRYVDSTLAYQGYGQGIDLEMLKQMNERATGGLTADLTLWIDMDARKALARSKQDELDQYDPEFYERVRAGYREIYKDERRVMNAVVRIDVDPPEGYSSERTEKEIWGAVMEVLEKR